MSAEKTEEELLRDLVLIDKAIREKEAVGHPGTYGMPDLLYPKGFKPGLPTYDIKGLHTSAPGEDFPDGWTREPLEQEETDLEYKTRQDNDLMSFLEANIYVTKDGKRRYFRVIDKIKPFICDVFFLRSKKVIVWKPRGGGGSLGASVLIWLLMIYHKRSVLDISGSGEQSKVVYNYVCQFWECIPGLAEGILTDEPLKEETRLKNGVKLLVKPGTEKQVRGKHMSTLAIDEVCQEDARVELAFRAALQTVLSEEDSIILLFSTFHLPSGLFQEYWDMAEEKGFTRVKWNVFDTMLPCKRGLEEATADDPKALCYCEKCDLTIPEFTTDDRGRKVQIGWAWCHGQARTSQGWESYDKIVAAMRMNIGTNVFSTEFSCERPNYSNSIYGPEVVDKALADLVPMSEDGELHVGIDWGIQSKNSLAITLVERRLEHLFVHEAVFWDHKLVSDVVILLNEWTEKYRKPLKIYCDRSHPFNNADLRKAGFEVNPVDFGTYKNIGISNISKYMIFRRMKINRNLGVLIGQLKKYRSDDAGKALKIDDHGPDSLMCACLDWKFENLFGEDAHRITLEDLRSQEEKQAMLNAKKVNIAALIPKDITSRIAIPKNFGINGLMP